MIKYYLFMVGSVILSSVSQVLLKKSAKQSHSSFIKEYLNPLVIIGYILMGGATLAMILGYRGMDYKNGPIIESIGYIMVMLMSYYFLKETITKKKILGYCLILIGVIVFFL